ncbi:MAG TPA: hypothetical protein PKE19_02050, partial [Aestuariivirga sp.]|nr:hypothetical protein [Aestuariivirga sp.]
NYTDLGIPDSVKKQQALGHRAARKALSGFWTSCVASNTRSPKSAQRFLDKRRGIKHAQPEKRSAVFGQAARYHV